jgi:TrmH RNA methyltransferase
MVRSAAFFDCPLVVISEGGGDAPLTTSAYRVAEGGMEYVEFLRVRNTAAFLKAASKYIVTIGTDTRARLRIRDLGGIIQDREKKLKPPPPPAAEAAGPPSASRTPARGRPGIALVLGNEETGLPREVKEQCSALVRIPGTGNIESLNAAQAAALFLHEVYDY